MRRLKMLGETDSIDIEIPDTVKEFTGLFSLSRKEIYEFDILEDRNGRKFKIWKEKGGFVMNQFQDDFYREIKDILFYQPLADMQNVSFIESTCEVIGNIKENPELLIKE